MPAPHTPEELIDRYKAKQPAPNSPTTPVEQLSFASEAVSLGYALEDVYSTLEGKADTTALAGLVDTTDSRLSDARTPTAHAHEIIDVTGLQTALDAKATPATVSTAIGALAAVAASGAYADLTGKPAIPTQYTDAQAVSANASAISTASTSDRARANHTGTQAATTITGLASVATSGSYADLSNKPTIPSAYTDAQAVSANASAIATASTADRNTDNHVSGTTNKVYTATEQSKLSGIAAGATANRFDSTTDAAITAAVGAEATARANADTTAATANAAALLAQKDRLPLNSLALGFGDSITQYNISTSTNLAAYQSRGIAAMANLLAGSRYTLSVLGVGGNTTRDMVDRLGPALALKPKLVIILGGANDLIGSVTAAAMCANLDIIYQSFLAISCRVIAITVLPSFGAYALTGPKETIRQTVNAYIKAYPGITAMDADLLNLTSASFSDGLHPSPAGANTIAVPLAALLAANIDPSPISGVITPLMGYTLNTLLTGTSGSLTSATGTVATSWTLDAGSNGGGATVVGSKTTTNNQDQQVITISGTYTGTTRAIDFFQTFATTALVTGDTVEGFVDYEILGSLTNIIAIHIQVVVNTSAFAPLATGFGMANPSTDAATPIQYPVGRYTDRTALVAIGAGTVANVVNRVRIVFKDTASALSCAGSIKVWRAGVRKVVA